METPKVDDVDYDPATHLAVLTLSRAIANDRLRLEVKDSVTLSGAQLDGEWVDGSSTFASGNGLAGGSFDFEFNVLPGDVTRDTFVMLDDAGIAYIANGASTDGSSAIPSPGGVAYTIFEDITGDGMVNLPDAGLTFQRMGVDTASLPTGSPGYLGSDSSGGLGSVLDVFAGWDQSLGTVPANSGVAAVPMTPLASSEDLYPVGVLESAGDEDYIDGLFAEDEVDEDSVDLVLAELGDDLFTL